MLKKTNNRLPIRWLCAVMLITGPLYAQTGNLTKINLSHQDLGTIPDSVFSHTDLTELIMSNTGLTTLPHEIGRLKNLKKLYLQRNQLTTLPPEIGQLENLTELYIDFNQLATLPPEIGHLKNLEVLFVTYNKINFLPGNIAGLKKMVTLRIGNNQLESLPPETGQLTSLCNLNLAGNQLTSLPPEIGRLTKLGTLVVSDNRLTTVPGDIGLLQNLYYLDLANNQLTVLPKEIGQLKKMDILDLSGNQLAYLPEEIGQLHKLQRLSMYWNKITTLPRQILSLTQATIWLDSYLLSDSIYPWEFKESGYRDIATIVYTGPPPAKEPDVDYGMVVKVAAESSYGVWAPPPPPPPSVASKPTVFKRMEEMPRFPGCENLPTLEEKKICANKKMFEFIYMNIKYPTVALENGVKGKVVISFVVEKDGIVTDARIIRDIGLGCGVEALRVVNLMNEKGIRWIPGRTKDRHERGLLNVSIQFPADLENRNRE